MLGPNGFHRHFTGNALHAFATARPNPEVHVEGNPRSGDLLVRFSNGGNGAARFSIEMNRYVSARAETYNVVERSENVIRLSLERSKFWYDFTVRVANQPGFTRRYAGRLETGEPSISDPAMFGTAIGEQLKIG